MVTKDLGIRFTEEKYATKNEVSKDLGISLVDNIWANILNYRSNFNRSLNLKSIEGNTLVFCACPSVNDNVTQLDFKIIRLMSDSASHLSSLSFKRSMHIECLKHLSDEYKLEASETYLRSIVDDEIKGITNSNKILVNYYNALRYIESAYVNNIDENFLAEIYRNLLGVDELTSFYRTNEDKSRDNRVLIDRIYTAAPVGAIDNMMTNLFNFIEKSNLSLMAKAILTYYYINYIKPFPSYNDEIAVLMMKGVLAHSNIGQTAALIPFERLLHDYLQENAKNCVEVQKTSDITYFINFGVKVLSQICDEYLNKIATISVNEMQKELYQADEELIEEVKEEKVEPGQEHVVVNEPVVEARPVQRELAVSYIPPVLDEKEATRLEQDLLESDPLLKKGEAYFFARHCTMNKAYTIAQYKRALGCAYETARTSMEHLVHLGYYRREQIKNKFIYTPVSRRKGE